MTIRGEYWYSNNDKLYPCDGDRNKFGHEGFAIYHARKVLKSELEKKIKKKDRWGDPLKLELMDDRFNDFDSSEKFKSKLEDYIDNFDVENDEDIGKLISVLNKPIINRDFFTICFSDEYGHHELDIVEYVIEKWKWIRIVGRDARGGIVKDIQVPELNMDYLKKASKAIQMASLKERKPMDQVNDIYNISTYKGQIYQIPLGDMQTGSMEALERENNEALTNVSKERVREMDKSISPSYYKGTIGDSYKFPKFKDFLKEMAYPLSFSFEEFNIIDSYKGKLKYANERLQKISSGSSRVVYKVDEEKVLKIAKNSKGLAQNATESDYSLQRSYDIVAKIFESSDDNFWVEMELARKTTPNRFRSLTSVSLKEVQDILYVLKMANDSYFRKMYSLETLLRMEKEQQEKLNNNEFLSQLWDMIGNYDMEYPADFGRISSYGEVSRDGESKIVLVDFGLTRTTYSDHYKR